MGRGGRKCLYPVRVEPRLDEVAAWAREGLSHEQIAQRLGIALSSLHLYRSQFSEFSDALRVSREIADQQVENALFKRAIGYEYVETREEIADGPQGPSSKTVTIRKQRAPDVTAQKFWLTVRRPDRWPAKADPDHADANVLVLHLDDRHPMRIRPAEPQQIEAGTDGHHS